MAISSSELTVRFGVGSPQGPKSGIWRVWTRRRSSDVYLAVRAMAGILKVSLHGSGACKRSLTAEFARKQPETVEQLSGSRHMDEWQRPTHTGSQITVAFRLSFPDSELRAYSSEYGDDPTIRWLDPPDPGHSVEVACAFSGQIYAPGEWPWKDRGVSLLNGTVLGNGEAFWLTYVTYPTFPNVAPDIEQQRTELRGPESLRFGELDYDSPSARLVVPGIDSNGVRVFTDAAMS